MLSRPFIPLLFVFLWSTGFIGSKLGAPYAEPATFLTIRMAITSVLLICLMGVLRKKWLQCPVDFLHSGVVGILIHGVYLGGVFTAIYQGVDAGLSALIVGLQPLLTVGLSAVWLGEAITRTKLLGILAGLIGVTLVISQSAGFGGMNTTGLAFCLVALLGITIGTVYQKRFCSDVELLPSVTVQYIAVTLFLLPFALLFEAMIVIWSPVFIFALAWLILVLSLGAVFLLMMLLKKGEAGRVSSLFYLVPPLVALEAKFLFGEQLNLIALFGMALCVIGVMLVINNPAVTSNAGEKS